MSEVASGVQFAKLPTKDMASGAIVHDVSEKVNLNVQNQTHTMKLARWLWGWQNNPEHSSKAVNDDGTPKNMNRGDPERHTTLLPDFRMDQCNRRYRCVSSGTICSKYEGWKEIGIL